MMDFMISSGLMTDMAAIPVPLFAVPYAAPKALKTMAAEAPITAKKEAYSGLPPEDMAARAGPGRGAARVGAREGGGGFGSRPLEGLAVLNVLG